MPQFYSKVGFELVLDSWEERERVRKLFEEFEAGKHPKYCEDSEDASTGCSVGAAGCRLWIYSDTDAQIDNLEGFVRLVVDKLQLSYPIGVEWANDCSDPCKDAYGGGAFVVRRGQKTQWLHTNRWLEEHMESNRAVGLTVGVADEARVREAFQVLQGLVAGMKVTDDLDEMVKELIRFMYCWDDIPPLEDIGLAM